MGTKQDDIEAYVNLYKSVHNHKPRGLDLQSWSREELQQGIRVLSRLGDTDITK